MFWIRGGAKCSKKSRGLRPREKVSGGRRITSKSQFFSGPSPESIVYFFFARAKKIIIGLGSGEVEGRAGKLLGFRGLLEATTYFSLLQMRSGARIFSPAAIAFLDPSVLPYPPVFDGAPGGGRPPAPLEKNSPGGAPPVPPYGRPSRII